MLRLFSYIGAFFIGGLAGAGIMLIVFPFIFPPPMVNESVADMYEFQPELVTVTEFRQNVDGHDLAHWGRGEVSIYQKSGDTYIIEFHSNFEVGPGPNFWIYLNSVSDIDNEDQFLADTNRTRITKIKSFQGSQVYEVKTRDLINAQAITIWCESFNQYIASANIDITV